jgi:aldehyde:ferredoxin oxidoreductase
MSEMYGYAGKILRVNLTTGEISDFSSDKYLPKYIGAKGLAARIYWDEIGPEVHPFDPENKVIFAAGPINATGAIGSAKGCLASKSPVWFPVHSFSHSSAGGGFSCELKRAGYDAVIIEGKANHPVYLWINDGKAEIRDGRDLWGKTTRNTRSLLWKKHGDKTIIATIGPAGENKVVQACVSVACNTTFGRGGFGAVMGSKNLKALAIRGTGRIPIAEPQKLIEINLDRAYGRCIAPGEKRMVSGKEIIGPEVNEIDNFALAGNLRDYTQVKQWAKLGLVEIKVGACEACSQHCRKKLKWQDGAMPNSAYICSSSISWAHAIKSEKAKRGINEDLDGRESVELANLVDDCGINMNDIAIIESYMGWSGKLGVQGEALESTLLGGDWLYQGYIWGIFNEENTGLPWSRFGTSEFSQKLIRMLTYREGFGDVLAQGFRYATRYIVEHEEFGPDRANMLTIYKRINTKAGNMGHIENGHGNYTPNSGRALDTAVRDRTGSEPEYMFSGMTYYKNTNPHELIEKWWGKDAWKATDHHYWGPEIAQTVIVHEQDCNINDSMHLCTFTSSFSTTYRDLMDAMTRTPYGWSEYLSAIFGKEVTHEELKTTGDMISNLIRAIFVRDGYTTIEDDYWGNDVDTHWDYTFERKDAQGNDLVNKEGFLQVRDYYYEQRGWIDGVPTRATLEKHDLKDVADDLERRGLLTG